MNIFDVARIVEVALTGKQPLAPILVDFEHALLAALRGVQGLKALNGEIQAAMPHVASTGFLGPGK